MIKKILLYLLSFSLFTPIFLDLDFYQPYITGKYFWLAFFILLSLPLLIYLLRPAKIWNSNLVRVVLGFFLGLIIINLFSIDSLRSWWGDWQRMDGLLYFILWLPLFLGLIIALNNKKSWLKFLRTHQLVVLVIVIWSWGQFMAWPIFNDIQADRTFSLLGNSGFLAHYLLLAFWLCLFLTKFDKQLKYLHLLLGLLILPALYQTDSRGAFIALIVSLLILVIYYVVYLWKQHRIKGFIGIGLALLIIMIAWPNLGHHYKDYALNDISVETRIIAWQAGLNGFKERPMLGWGRNNFQIPFNKYLDLKIYKGADSRMWFDKAHNQYIDYLVEGGLIGLVLYLIFLATPFFYLRKIKANYSTTISLLIGLGLLTNLIFLLFNFDTIASWLLYFIYLSLIFFLAKTDKISIEENRRLTKSTMSWGAIVAIVGLFFLVYQPAIANIKLKKIYLSNTNNLPVTEIGELSQTIAKQAPQYQSDLSLVLIQTIDKSNLTLDEKIYLLEYSLFYSQQASQQHLLDAKLHFMLANTYLQLGASQESPERLYQALNYYQQVIPKLTPANRPGVSYNLAQTYYELSFLEEEQKDNHQQQAFEVLKTNAQKFPKAREAQEKLEIIQTVINSE